MIHRILIKQVELNQQPVDILIERNQISRIGTDLVAEEAEVIDAKGMAVIPGLVNGHTHAAMTLFRGFADDMKLMPWLQLHFWICTRSLEEQRMRWRKWVSGDIYQLSALTALIRNWLKRSRKNVRSCILLPMNMAHECSTY